MSSYVYIQKVINLMYNLPGRQQCCSCYKKVQAPPNIDQITPMLFALQRNYRQRMLRAFWHVACYSTHNTHTSLTALFAGLPRWAGIRKVKPIWILLKQETVSGSSISWTIYNSASRSRQITTPAPHHSFFTGRMPFLPPNQQHQSTQGQLRK